MGYADIKEMLKDARNLASGANDYQTVNLLKDIQIEVFDLLEENRKLRDELHELKNVKLTDEELEYHNGVYTKGKDVYCGVCWDRDKRLARVRKVNKDENNGSTVFSCDVCKQWRFSDILFEE